MTNQNPDLFNVWLRGIDGAPDEPHMSFPEDQREEAEFEILDLKDHGTKAYFGPSFPAKDESPPQHVKTRRICAGEYETTNTVPIARISKSMDGDGTWNVSWGGYDGGHSGYYGAWGNKKECLSLIKSISEDFTPETHDSHIKVG